MVAVARTVEQEVVFVAALEGARLSTSWPVGDLIGGGDPEEVVHPWRLFFTGASLGDDEAVLAGRLHRSLEAQARSAAGVPPVRLDPPDPEEVVGDQTHLQCLRHPARGDGPGLLAAWQFDGAHTNGSDQVTWSTGPGRLLARLRGGARLTSQP